LKNIKNNKKGDFCINIGAHLGDTTLPVALAAGKTGYVLALEPNPFVYHVLEKNARANRHLYNIGTIMAAALKEDGFATFEYSDQGYCNGGHHEGISVLMHGHAYKLNIYGINLEKELRENYSDWLPKLKFIKVDTEGYDLYVLETLSDIITFKPVTKSEIFKHTDINYRKKVLHFFKNLNYSIYKVKAEPITYDLELTDELLLNEKHYDIIASPMG